MRILHVTPRYAPGRGGAELYLAALSEGLAARGHVVTVFTANVIDVHGSWISEHGGLGDEEVINGVRVVRFDPRPGIGDKALDGLVGMRGGWRVASTLLSPSSLELVLQGPRTLQMLRAILREQTDVIVSTQWFFPQAYYVHIARRLKCFPLVGLPFFHTAEPWCGRAIYSEMLARCDAVAVLTDHEKQYAEARGARSTDVVGVGVSPRDFVHRNGAEVRARYGLGDLPVVGLVGRQDSGKGVAKLIEAMDTVWRWNADARLVLAGHSVPDVKVRTALNGLSASQRERVVQIGEFADADKGSIFDAIDVFAMPSREESFGIAYLEAWLCGKPVIGARIASTACVIEDGRDGLLVDPDSPPDIGRAIVSLLANRDLAAKMGSAGRAKTIAQHTWDSVIDRAEALYHRVAKVAADGVAESAEATSRE